MCIKMHGLKPMDGLKTTCWDGICRNINDYIIIIITKDLKHC